MFGNTSQMDSFLMTSHKADSHFGDLQVQQAPFKLPDYVQKDQFKEFLAKHKSQLQPNNSGYMVILTDKECYYTGDMVCGTVLCDLFQPTKQQDIFIMFKGEQRVPQRLADSVDQRYGHSMHEKDDEQIPLLEGHDAIGNLDENGPNFDMQSNSGGVQRRSSHRSGRFSLLSRAEREGAATSTKDTRQGTDSAAQRQDSIQFEKLLANINQLRATSQERNQSFKSITSPSPRRLSKKGAASSMVGGSSSGAQAVMQTSNDKTPDPFMNSITPINIQETSELGKFSGVAQEKQTTEKVYCTDFSTQLNTRAIFSNNLASNKDQIILKQQSQLHSQSQTPLLIGDKVKEVAHSTQQVELAKSLGAKEGAKQLHLIPSLTTHDQTSSGMTLAITVPEESKSRPQTSPYSQRSAKNELLEGGQPEILEGGEYETPASGQSQHRIGKNKVGIAVSAVDSPNAGGLRRFNSDDIFQENDLVEEASIVLRDSDAIGSYLVFKLDDRLFKFRGTQMPEGQYMWNFTFQIPESKTPSSFQYITATGDSFSVKYSITVHFNDKTPLMTQSKEIQIVSRAKMPRRTPEERRQKVGNTSIGQTMAQKERDDATFHILDENFISPNKVGFDSLESAIHDNSKIDLNMKPRYQGRNIAREEAKTGTSNGSHNYNINALILDRRESQVATGNPYDRSSDLKKAQANPDRSANQGKKQRQVHDADPRRESIFFEKYACLCPGTMSLEVTLRSGIISPRSNIDLDFDLNKSFSHIQKIDVTLVLDLKVQSLSEPRNIVEQIIRELGTETITKEELLRNSDGHSLIYAFKLSQIQERNELIKRKYLHQHPHGINIVQIQQTGSSSMHNEQVHQFMATMQNNLAQSANNGRGVNSKRVAVGPVGETQFSHEDAQCGAWDQAYQFCHVGTCNSAVVKANYHLRIDFTIKAKLGFKTSVRSMNIPFRLMEPPRQVRIKNPDLTKGETVNAKVVEPLLKYPTFDDLPDGVTPMMLPGGHYRIEKFKKQKKPQDKKVTQQDNLVLNFMPAPAFEEQLANSDVVSLARRAMGSKSSNKSSGAAIIQRGSLRSNNQRRLGKIKF